MPQSRSRHNIRALPLLVLLTVTTPSSAFALSYQTTLSSLFWNSHPASRVVATTTTNSLQRDSTMSATMMAHASHHHNTPQTRLFMATNPYNKVFVAGGTNGVGQCVVQQLIDANIPVVALARNPQGIEVLKKMGVIKAVLGDAMDQKSVENAMDGCDAAISTLGEKAAAVATNEDPKRRVDYVGNSNVIESAGILGIQRIVCVTSIGCGSSREVAPLAVSEVLKGALEAKEKAENLLQKYYTNSNWTIIRPGGLQTKPMTGKAILTEDHTAIGSIHRQDLAALLVQALHSPNTERKILSAVDPSITSTIVASEGRQYVPFSL